MDLTVHIDDKALPLFYDAYGVQGDFGAELDEKQKIARLVSILKDTIYNPIMSMKLAVIQRDSVASVELQKSRELTIAAVKG